MDIVYEIRRRHLVQHQTVSAIARDMGISRPTVRRFSTPLMSLNMSACLRDEMAKIGIFWVYKEVVFGRTRCTEEGQEGVKGLVDSPDDHVTVWEGVQGYRSHFPELHGREYQDVPRGRVLYQQSTSRSLVYLDKTLNSPAIRQLIAQYFEFEAGQASWRADLHYTTRHEDLDDLFSEADS